MDTSRPIGDRVPFGDLTNTTHRGNYTRPGLVQLDGDPNGQKRLRETDQYATMFDEKSSERNKKRREGDTTDQTNKNSDRLHMHSTYSNGAEQLSDGNTTDERDENSDWLHRNSTYYNGLQELSDVPVPLSTIDGTGDVDNIDTEEDNNIVHETGPINRLVMYPKEPKGDRDRARNAAMSPQQRALLNKRKREMYAKKNDKKKSAKMLEMTPKETTQSTGGPVSLSIGVPGDIDDGLIETDINTVHEMGTPLKNRGFVLITKRV